MSRPLPKPTAYSERAKTLPGSPLRALLSSARGHDQLDLGGGIPDPALFPSQALADVAAHILTDQPAEVLQYSPTEGLWPLRGFIADRLVQRGCRIRPEQILVTHGSQQALASVAALVTSPTQAVALEQPVYPGAQQAFAFSQAPVLALPVTPDGWDHNALRARDVAAIYVIPNHQNPTGRKATAQQRGQLADYAESTGTFVIEDDAYGELDFDEPLSRPLIADAPTRGILLGSFSKTLCPGLRVGWIAAPRELIDPLTRVLQACILQPGTLAQHLARGLLERLDWTTHLTQLRHVYAERALLLRAHLAAFGLQSAAPRGGFFLWLEVPLDAERAAKRAASAGVVVVPERAFRHPSHPGPNRHLRVAFSRYVDSEQNRETLRAALG